MTKIQELANRINNMITSYAPDAPGMIQDMVDELAGIAEAPQVAYGADEPPADTGEGYSDDVLIDYDGHRKHFTVGWYDHDEKRWMFREEDTSLLELEHMKWTYLNLAKYDKK